MNAYKYNYIINPGEDIEIPLYSESLIACLDNHMQYAATRQEAREDVKDMLIDPTITAFDPNYPITPEQASRLDPIVSKVFKDTGIRYINNLDYPNSTWTKVKANALDTLTLIKNAYKVNAEDEKALISRIVTYALTNWSRELYEPYTESISDLVYYFCSNKYVQHVLALGKIIPQQKVKLTGRDERSIKAYPLPADGLRTIVHSIIAYTTQINGDAKVSLVIANAESRLNPHAICMYANENSVGLFQVNNPGVNYWPEYQMYPKDHPTGVDERFSHKVNAAIGAKIHKRCKYELKISGLEAIYSVHAYGSYKPKMASVYYSNLASSLNDLQYGG